MDYFNLLPADAKKGDAYTVRYKGTTGTDPDGAEYVQVGEDGADDWVMLGPDLHVLEARIAKAEEDISTLDEKKLDKADVYLLYGGLAEGWEVKSIR